MAYPYLALRPTRNGLVSHYAVASSNNPLPLGMGSVKPVYNADNPQSYPFSGNRIHRRIDKTKNGIIFNADINGAFNILCRSNVVRLTVLYSRGEVNTPIRIRGAWVSR